MAIPPLLLVFFWGLGDGFFCVYFSKYYIGVLKLGKKWQTQIQEEDLNVAPSLDLGSIQLDLMDCQERDPTVILNDPTEMNELVTLASRSTSD